MSEDTFNINTEREGQPANTPLREGMASLSEREQEKLDQQQRHSQNIKGIILFQPESEGTTMVKWIGWIIVMCLIVMVFIWYGFYFDHYKCDLDVNDIRKNSEWTVLEDTGLYR